MLYLSAAPGDLAVESGALFLPSVWGNPESVREYPGSQLAGFARPLRPLPGTGLDAVFTG
jgi:hypothetical protein